MLLILSVSIILCVYDSYTSDIPRVRSLQDTQDDRYQYGYLATSYLVDCRLKYFVEDATCGNQGVAF